MEVLSEERRKGVWWVMLNRPSRKNALSKGLLRDLSQTLDKIQREGGKIVVLKGNGGAFSAGGDLKECLESGDPVSWVQEAVTLLNALIIKIRRAPFISVALVEGVAVGAGLSLALSSDLIVASEEAIFNIAYRRIGFTPDGGGSAFLPKIIGEKKYNELYLLSRDISAQEAKELGIVNFVFPREKLEEEVEKLVEELLSLPHGVIPFYKSLVNAWLYKDLEEQLQRERDALCEVVKGTDVKSLIQNVLTRKRS
jgi:2-(1,2-epoxy-1,2-dihydrophenyl)acetyl-CoA isomerase